MKKIRIAIQGYEGSFHHQAAVEYFGEQTEVIPCSTFRQLIALVESGDTCDAGIMAIENSIAGSIMPNYGLIKNAEVQVFGEIILRIQQNLMALPGQRTEDLKEIRSHYMAIEQCRDFLADFPEVKLTESEDTALSAKKISEKGEAGVAAIASEAAAKLYELEVLVPAIETDPHNYTRFMVLARPEKLQQSTSSDKASVVVTFNEYPGSLAENLARLAAVGINLSKVQSYPIPGKTWRYYFYLDMEFNAIAQFYTAVETLKEHTNEVQILGIYNKSNKSW